VTVRLRPEALEGTLQGYVFEQGTTNRIADAVVVIVNEATGERFERTTNYDGFYRFTDLDLGRYTVVAWADGFSVAASPNSPVTLAAGTGVHEDINLTPGDYPGYRLVVTVVGAPADIVELEMAGVTFARLAGTNIWEAASATQMLGEVEASARFFVTAYYEVTSGSYTNRVAHVTLRLVEVDAVARFHFDGNVVEVVLELGAPSPTAIAQ
jgi:hypothetical protein